MTHIIANALIPSIHSKESGPEVKVSRRRVLEYTEKQK